jgi:hypothetical protein
MFGDRRSVAAPQHSYFAGVGVCTVIMRVWHLGRRGLGGELSRSVMLALTANVGLKFHRGSKQVQNLFRPAERITPTRFESRFCGVEFCMRKSSLDVLDRAAPNISVKLAFAIFSLTIAPAIARGISNKRDASGNLSRDKGASAAAIHRGAMVSPAVLPIQSTVPARARGPGR